MIKLTQDDIKYTSAVQILKVSIFKLSYDGHLKNDLRYFSHASSLVDCITRMSCTYVDFIMEGEEREIVSNVVDSWK